MRKRYQYVQRSLSDAEALQTTPCYCPQRRPQGGPLLGQHRNTDHAAWLKFDDNRVSEMSWEAIKDEGTGSQTKTSSSAYSLIDIDENQGDLLQVSDADTRPGADKEALPDDLETFIMEDTKVGGKSLWKGQNPACRTVRKLCLSLLRRVVEGLRRPKRLEAV